MPPFGGTVAFEPGTKSSVSAAEAHGLESETLPTHWLCNVWQVPQPVLVSISSSLKRE